MNQPATAEATGLEVDKLNSVYVKNYMNRYLDSYEETVGAGLIGKRGIQYMITDSWEDGSQNWTDDMIAQIKYLNRVVLNLQAGLLERESGHQEIQQIQNKILAIVRSLPIHAGVEDE